MHESAARSLEWPREDGIQPDQQFRALLEALPVAAYTCDAEGLITYYNRQAVELWGRAPELNSPVDRWCGSFRLYTLDGEPIPHEDCWMARAIKNGRPYNGCELVIERPDGRRLTGLAHANPLIDTEGRLVGAVNVLVDISDRARADLAQARLGAIVESSDDAILSKTLEGQILSWNGGAERLFGYRAEEAIGQPITLIVPPDRLEEEADILAKLSRGERIQHYETVRLTRDGTPVHISVTTSPVRNARGKVTGASTVARDITTRKQHEEALRRLHDELQAADQAKNDFLATLAHELRNPLAPIRNTVATLELLADAAPEVLASVGVIGRQVRQLTRLIDDLLDVSRITRNKLELRREPVELADVLHAAVEASRPLLTAKGHDFGVDLPAEPIVLHADLTRLAQVVSNLLNNAAKYTDRDGRIRLAARREGAEAIVTVRDNGGGIPAELYEKIFEIFAQFPGAVRDSPGGLGIGLHLARRLAELHGGTLTVDSAGPGQGSEFRLRLPLPAAPGAVAQRPSDGSAVFSRLGVARLRLLVVDDNRDAADSLGVLLRLPGHEVRIAYDGAQAIETAEGFRPDAVLLDIGLPVLDGYEVARRIRAAPWGNTMILIALTGWGQPEARLQSRDAGFDAHLVKPVDPTELMNELGRCRQRRIGSSS